MRAQTLPVSQLVVVDDASTDSTAEIARSYQGLNAEVVRLDKNVGAAAARNRGVMVANTELVAFLDADDEWLPTKLEKQAGVIAQRTGFALCLLLRLDLAMRQHRRHLSGQS